MANIANLVAFDGASTPVSHTLVPVSVSREGKTKVLAEWREALASIPVYAQVKTRMSLERLPTGVYKCVNRVSVPVMESVSGQNASGYTAAPKIAYENTVETTGLFHERSDVAGRRLARQLSLNINGGIVTSVTPSTTGPAPDLFDLLTAPT